MKFMCCKTCKPKHSVLIIKSNCFKKKKIVIHLNTEPGDDINVVLEQIKVALQQSDTDV